MADPARSIAMADLPEIYERLLAAYGPQNWWPADSPFEMIVGAILTQNTAWTNVEKAIACLRAADKLSPAAFREASTADLARLIRSSGFYNAKARKLKAFVEHLYVQHGGDLSSLFDQPARELRRELLGIHGIGPETADSIVLYGAGQALFVVDAYTRRLFDRLGLLEGPSYDEVQRFCQERLPADPKLFNEFHALIVRHSVVRCRARPRCADCPLASQCPSYNWVES